MAGTRGARVAAWKVPDDDEPWAPFPLREVMENDRFTGVDGLVACAGDGRFAFIAASNGGGDEDPNDDDPTYIGVWDLATSAAHEFSVVESFVRQILRRMPP